MKRHLNICSELDASFIAVLFFLNMYRIIYFCIEYDYYNIEICLHSTNKTKSVNVEKRSF